MKRVILFEDEGFRRLLPLVYWRPVGDLRCGYYTLTARLERALGTPVTDTWVRPELEWVVRERHQARVNQPVEKNGADPVLWVNARYLPCSSRLEPEPGTMGMVSGQIAYAYPKGSVPASISPQDVWTSSDADPLTRGLRRVEAEGEMIDYPWDLIVHNERLSAEDGSDDLENDGMNALPAEAILIDKQKIRLARGARIMPGAVLDASHGPIFIDRDATVSPLAVVQGPCFIGERCLIQPGASIRRHCAFGPGCKLGGEIEATIIQGHTNKQHDGFLGHAYIGEWVNLGADTVNSDLKNTYGSVRVPINGVEVDSGQTFVGTFIGDHAKIGIGQTFSTGSVVGFGANVATSTFPPKFVPSFSWLTDRGMATYDPKRCLAVAEKVMGRRNVTMSAAERTLFGELSRICRELEKPQPA